MVNALYLQSADVVELDITDNKYTDEVTSILSVVNPRGWVQKTFGNSRILKKLGEMCDITAVIGKDIDIKLEEGVEITVAIGSESVIFDTNFENKTYGFVIDNNGFPFVVYSTNNKVIFTPYAAIMDKITGVYRHLSSNNEYFRAKLVYNTLLPDLVNHLSDKPNAWEVAYSFLGNTGLNYIMLVYGLLGTEFPAKWADKGAPNEILTDFTYGFRKV